LRRAGSERHARRLGGRRVDHGRGYVAVAEELLHRANVVAALQEVCGEGVAEGVAGHPVVEASLARRILLLGDEIWAVRSSRWILGVARKLKSMVPVSFASKALLLRSFRRVLAARSTRKGRLSARTYLESLFLPTIRLYTL
jgi:hypothetical protein